MLPLDQILLICETLELDPSNYHSYIETLLVRIFQNFGQAGLDRIQLILERITELEEKSFEYAGDANSSLIAAESLKWSEGGRTKSVERKGSDYARKLAVMLGAPELAQGKASGYPGYTVLRRM